MKEAMSRLKSAERLHAIARDARPAVLDTLTDAAHCGVSTRKVLDTSAALKRLADKAAAAAVSAENDAIQELAGEAFLALQAGASMAEASAALLRRYGVDGVYQHIADRAVERAMRVLRANV